MKLTSYTRSFALLVTLAVVLLDHAAHAVGWVARHGLTGAQYQTEFNKWTAAPFHLRLASIVGYEESGQARFAALWEQTSGPGWGSIHGLSEASFVQQMNTMKGQGMRLAYFNAFGVGAQAYFNGIWETSGNTNQVFQPSMTWSEYTSVSANLTAQGYRLIDICPFNVGSLDLYAALWEKPRGLVLIQTTFRHRETGPDYQATFNTLTAAGWRLDGVQGFSLAGQARFTSRWTKLPAGDWWWSLHGMNAANYQGAMYNAQYQGYRPTFVTAFKENGETRFNAIWMRNGGFGLDTIGQIDTAVNDYMKDHGIPGLTVAISRQGRLVFAKGYGYADQEAGEAVHPLHRFRIASVSKPICATAMMKLVDGNAVELTNKVFGTGTLLGTTYGSGSYSTREKAITVTHLLSHTTGWNDSTEGPIWDNANGNNTAAVIDQVLDGYEPVNPPGTDYDYSNIGYCVAARVIERKTGLTFEQYVKNNILAPCGITSMEIGNQTLAGRKAREVKYYDPNGYSAYDINPHRMDANGGWISTAMDLLLFGRRIDGDAGKSDVIGAASLASMRAGSSANMTYGLGLFWDGARTWFGHNGCMTGTLGWLITREDDIHIAAMTNLRPNDDSCGSTFGTTLRGICSTLKAKNAWPAIDLFPSTNPGFDSWTDARFDAATQAQLGLKETIWGPGADPDGDGDPNLVEAYFSNDPLAADADFHGRAYASSDSYAYRWLRPLNTHGVQGDVVWRNSLTGTGAWTESGIELSTVPRLIAPLGFQWTEATLPRAGRPRAFMRLDLTAP